MVLTEMADPVYRIKTLVYQGKLLCATLVYESLLGLMAKIKCTLVYEKGQVADPLTENHITIFQGEH